ncbi:MAG: hypothetical protein M0Q91_07550 [Methanoregula sp.]|jgi:hypothetical protein|nr:hypothetical protein [Methanoregula sp.]
MIPTTTITGHCKVCGKDFPLSADAHEAYRSYCPVHLPEMLEDHDREAVE